MDFIIVTLKKNFLGLIKPGKFGKVIDLNFLLHIFFKILSCAKCLRGIVDFMIKKKKPKQKKKKTQLILLFNLCNVEC